MEFSIVIPTFNEEKRIENTVRQIYKYFTKKRKNFEVIVIDDGSSDGTVRLLQDLKKKLKNLKILKQGKNYGKDWAVKRGVLVAKGKYILTKDADLSTPMVETDKLLKELEVGADLAISCRIHPDGKDMRFSQPLIRRIVGKIFSKLVNVFVINGIRDTQAGTKMYKADVAKKLFRKQTIKRIAFDVEILYLAKRAGMNIAVVPVMWSTDGKSRMRFFKELMVLWDIFTIKFNHR